MNNYLLGFFQGYMRKTAGDAARTVVQGDKVTEGSKTAEGMQAGAQAGGGVSGAMNYNWMQAPENPKNPDSWMQAPQNPQEVAQRRQEPHADPISNIHYPAGDYAPPAVEQPSQGIVQEQARNNQPPPRIPTEGEKAAQTAVQNNYMKTIQPPPAPKSVAGTPNATQAAPKKAPGIMMRGLLNPDIPEHGMAAAATPKPPQIAKTNSQYLAGFLQGYLQKSAGAMSRDAGYVDTNERLRENAGNQIAKHEAVNPNGLVSPETARNSSDIQRIKRQGAPSHDEQGNEIDPEFAEQYAWAMKTIPHSKDEEFKIDQIKQMATLKSRIARGRAEYDAGLAAKQGKVDTYNQGMAEREGVMPREINNEKQPPAAVIASLNPQPNRGVTQNAGTGKPTTLGQHLQRDASAQKAHDAEQLAKLNARTGSGAGERKYVASGDSATINGKPVVQNDIIDHEGLKRVADSRQKADQEFVAATPTRGINTASMGGSPVARSTVPAKRGAPAFKTDNVSLKNGLSAGVRHI